MVVYNLYGGRVVSCEVKDDRWDSCWGSCFLFFFSVVESNAKVVIVDNLKLNGGIVGLAQLSGGRVVFFQVEDNRWRGFCWRIHWESCDF